LYTFYYFPRKVRTDDDGRTLVTAGKAEYLTAAKPKRAPPPVYKRIIIVGYNCEKVTQHLNESAMGISVERGEELSS